MVHASPLFLWVIEMKLRYYALAGLAVLVGTVEARPYLFKPDAMTTVKVLGENGHGSATNIGNGYFVTAAHVLHGENEVKLKTSSGNQATADVLWASDKYDIALMKSDVTGVDAANIECRRPERGEYLKLSGNPINMEFIDTRGHVAGDVMFDIGPWGESIPVDAAIAPGMSGGGAFDKDGDLVGVNAGVMIMPVGMAGGPVGLAYVVPSSVVCMLMGRV